MPAEPELPVELTAELQSVESLLRGFSPIDSEINRDVTLYEAGWAAAMMQARGGTHWLWPATSAVLAASLLLLITPPLASSLQRAGPQPQAHPLTNQAHKRTAPPQSPLAQSQPPRNFSRPPKIYPPTASLLTLRDRALRMEFDEPVSYVGIDDDDSTPKAVTARELMLELLGETS